MPSFSVAALDGHPQHLGDLTIVRKGIVPGPYTSACQDILVLADHAEVGITASGGKRFDLCKLAEVGTATAVNALAQHGITYRPGRTAAWPIANSDACDLLTPTELTTLGGVDPTIRMPGYADWWCGWGPSAANVQLQFRLNTAYLPNYGTPTTIADRRAWLQHVTYTNPHQCIAVVVSHPAGSLTDTTEMISVTVKESQPDQKLCACQRSRRRRRHPSPYYLSSHNHGSVRVLVPFSCRSRAVLVPFSCRSRAAEFDSRAVVLPPPQCCCRTRRQDGGAHPRSARWRPRSTEGEVPRNRPRTVRALGRPQARGGTVAGDTSCLIITS
jgi:hypothetical protein